MPLLYHGCFFAWIYMFDHAATPCGQAVKVNSNCSSLCPFTCATSYWRSSSLWKFFVIITHEAPSWLPVLELSDSQPGSNRKERGRETFQYGMGGDSKYRKLWDFMHIHAINLHLNCERKCGEMIKKNPKQNTYTCRNVCSICASCSVPEELWKAWLSYLIEHPNSRSRFQ